MRVQAAPSTAIVMASNLQDNPAQFGEFALRSDDLDKISPAACRLLANALGTDLAKVMELQEDGMTLRMRAGVGGAGRRRP